MADARPAARLHEQADDRAAIAFNRADGFVLSGCPFDLVFEFLEGRAEAGPCLDCGFGLV